MELKSFYPVVQVDDPDEVARVFIEHFGFETTFAAEWYVSLRNGSHELAMLDATHPTIPEGFRHTCRGLLLNVEVDDAASEYARATDAGLAVRLALRDEPFGQRHFIVEIAGGILVDVIEEIEPAPEFAEAFA